ncbi:hypothetical protein USB125703_00692 [Pseudoclavibacter triregionum]|nr:hypothetical protein USB125703_00692 [Pseudoclavibacter triregionum]
MPDGRTLRSVPFASPRSSAYATGDRVDLVVDPADASRVAVPGSSARIARNRLSSVGVSVLILIAAIIFFAIRSGADKGSPLLRSGLELVPTLLPILLAVIGGGVAIGILRAGRVPADAVRTTTEIVDIAVIRRARSDGRPRYSRLPIFEFPTRDGRKIVGQSQVWFSGGVFDIGKRVELRYDPADPRRFWTSTSVGSIFGVALGLVFVMVGIGVFLVASPLSPLRMGG